MDLEKTNALLNLINNQPDIDKIYLYAKDPYKAKYKYLIKKREKVGLNDYDDPKAFIKYSNDTKNAYKNIDEYNADKEHKILIVFDDMIAYMINNKKLNSKVNRNNIIYYSSKEPIDFKIFKTIRSFGEDIYSGKITINEADQEQADLIEYILNFNNKARPKNKDDTKNKKYVLNTAQNLHDGRELVINAFNSSLFSLKSIIETGLKILTPKQMLQRIPIALAQVKAGNNSEHLLNGLRKIVYSFYQSKEITKKVYNNIIKSMP